MVFLTPTWLPAGGVVKILDYVTHARSMGFAVDLHGPTPFSPDLPVFAIERFATLANDPGTAFHPASGSASTRPTTASSPGRPTPRTCCR